MKLGSLLLATGLLVASPSMTLAKCYVCDRDAWDKLEMDIKLGFVMGALQSELALWFGDDEHNSYVKDTWQCLYDQSFDATKLVDLVDKGYSTVQPPLRAPNVVLAEEVRSVCLESINKARTERGQEPLQ